MKTQVIEERKKWTKGNRERERERESCEEWGTSMGAGVMTVMMIVVIDLASCLLVRQQWEGETRSPERNYIDFAMQFARDNNEKFLFSSLFAYFWYLIFHIITIFKQIWLLINNNNNNIFVLPLVKTKIFYFTFNIHILHAILKKLDSAINVYVVYDCYKLLSSRFYSM